ncbi:MAG: LLM class flavin-dependent oxidoreductase [Theionarchaea archaeon]|nr:LLM class flavin-dependent oxidoreductase [Theionarchaea archaeon]
MKFGLDVATVKEYHDPNTIVSLASEAEEAGWEGFFIWDTLLYPTSVPVLDPLVALSAIAVKTIRIKLGAMVTPVPRRRPWKLAREMATLDQLSGGRLVFGAGLGWLEEEFTGFGEEEDPVIRGQKLDEGLEVLNGLWSGESFTFEGKHFRVDGMQMLPKPMQSPRIPVWIAGSWPNRGPFRRAARWDGVYPGKSDGSSLKPDELGEILEFMKPYMVEGRHFDVVVAGSTPSDPEDGSRIVEPFERLGATWWLESVSFERGSLDEMRERIAAGPPGPM